MPVKEFIEDKEVAHEGDHKTWFLDFMGKKESVLDIKCWKNPNTKATFRDLFYEAKFKQGTIKSFVECKYDRYKTRNFVSEIIGSMHPSLIESNKTMSFVKEETEAEDKTVRYGSGDIKYNKVWDFIKENYNKDKVKLGLGYAPIDSIPKSLIFAYCMIKLDIVYYWRGRRIRDYTVDCFNSRKFSFTCTHSRDKKRGTRWYSISMVIPRKEVLKPYYLLGEYPLC
tara:strand:- start:12009 stop:12686 length:678 start_codon:yes stop_codon:yes gene_type:complete